MTRPNEVYRSASGGAGQGAPGADWHWLDFAAILLDRLWIAIPVLALAVGAGIYQTHRQVPMYRSSARIMVEEALPKVLNAEDMMFAGARNLQYFNTHVLALSSRTMAEGALRRTGLGGNPRFVATNAPMASRVSAALGYVRVEPVPQSRLIDIIVEHPDPEMAALFANGLAEQYIEANLNRREEVSTESFGWLKQQADGYRAKVEKGHAAMLDYRESVNAVSLEENANIVVGKLKAINEDLTAADAELGVAEAEWKEIEAARREGKPLGLLACIRRDEAVQVAQGALQRQQTEVGLLKTRYRERHPTLTAAIAQEQELAARFEAACRDTVPRIETGLRHARERVARLKAALEVQEKAAMDLDRKLVKYNELKREVEADRQMYEAIATRMKEAKIIGEVKASNIRLVDRAEPAGSPFRPLWRKAILTSVLIGLFLGVGLSFATYFLDDRMKRVEDVEHALGMPLLAVVPPVAAKRAKERTRAVDLLPNSPAAEAFRSLRASLALRQGWAECRRLMVTSTTAGEGKSTVACNLALVLAQSGQRTLLIDADMRRPTLRNVFETDGKAGLSDHLAGRVKLDQAIVPTGIANLQVMTAGGQAVNPSELLASAAMRAFLAECEQRFDRIVLDCPPIFGVSDPVSLLPAAHAVIFVVHYGKTGRRAAVRAMRMVREGGVPLIGLVFNNVALKLSSGYYYYYQYHKYGVETGAKARGAARKG